MFTHMTAFLSVVWVFCYLYSDRSEVKSFSGVEVNVFAEEGSSKSS